MGLPRVSEQCFSTKGPPLLTCCFAFDAIALYLHPGVLPQHRLLQKPVPTAACLLPLDRVLPGDGLRLCKRILLLLHAHTSHGLVMTETETGKATLGPQLAG